jgi:hypothetical protein
MTCTTPGRQQVSEALLGERRHRRSPLPGKPLRIESRANEKGSKMDDRITVTWPEHLAGKTGVVVNRPTNETANVRLDDGEEMVLHTDNFKIRVFGVWYGGSSYSYPEIPQDVEQFDSLEEAKEALQSRYENGYFWRQEFNYVNKPAASDLYPAVGTDSYMDIYYVDPSNVRDPYPDLRLILVDVGEDVRVTEA